MGIKYNGSDVQAIYYNGFTIAKMMNNGNSVWSKPAGSIIIESRFSEWVATGELYAGSMYHKFYTHPDGYTAVLHMAKIENGTIANDGGAAHFTMQIPELANRDYKLTAIGEFPGTGFTFYQATTGKGVQVQGKGTWEPWTAQKGPGFRITASKQTSSSSTQGYNFWVGYNDSLVHWDSQNTTQFIVPLTFRSRYTYTPNPLVDVTIYQERIGTSLYIKATSTSTGSVIYEDTLLNVPFYQDGDFLGIMASPIKSFTLEIL